MNDYTKQQIRLHLKDYLTEISRKGNDDTHFFNPTDNTDSKASLSITTDGTAFKDFGYNGNGLEKGDIFTLYAYINGLDVKNDFKQICRELAAKYNISIDEDYTAQKRSPSTIKQELKQQEEEQKQEDLTNYYTICRKKLEASEEARNYLLKRCISEELQAKYNIGYDKEKKQIIIPCNKYYYKGRSIDDTAHIKHSNPKGVKVSLWNYETLKNSTKDTCIIITESITDALSIENGNSELKTIALNSTSNKDLLYKAIDYYKYKGYFILALDSDITGLEASLDIHRELANKNIFSYIYNQDENTYSTEAKDFNELAQLFKGDKDSLNNLATNLFSDGQEAYKQYILKDLKPTTEYLSELEEDIKNGDTYTPTPTNITELDKVLNGGLFAKNLIVLTADTSIGKTAFALQVADSIARKKPVLYFSLEMSQAELIARSISRYMSEWQPIDTEHLHELNYSQLDILQGKMYSNPEALNIYETAKAQYISDIQDRLIIYECLNDKENTITAITEKISNYIAKTEQKPIVFIDYLQYIDADEQHATDKQATDKIIRELKKTARLYAIPIFAISSRARSTYNTETTLESGKNSGDIEYTADVMIGLNLEAVQEIKQQANGKLKADDRKKIKQASKQHTRKIYLTIMKNRNGARDKDIKGIDFTPIINTFDFSKAHIE